MRWPLALALVLLAPTAAAGVPFVLELEDAGGDVKDPNGTPRDFPSADILSFRSEVVNGSVVQRVRMAATPKAPEDVMFVRSWFHNSSNGSFWTIDMEVRGSEQPDKRFIPLMRRDSFHNATYLGDAKYTVENRTTWVFTFNASLVEDATCFDPGIFSEHHPNVRTGLPQSFDALYLPPERRQCLTTEEPGTPLPPPIRFNIPSVSAEAPGSEAPTPGPGVLVAVGALVVAALRARRAQ